MNGKIHESTRQQHRNGQLSWHLGRTLLAMACSVMALSAYSEEGGNSGVIEEIVVTATFRETNLMDPPAAITAADSDLIEQLGASDMSELFRSLPGLNGEHKRPRTVGLEFTWRMQH